MRITSILLIAAVTLLGPASLGFAADETPAATTEEAAPADEPADKAAGGAEAEPEAEKPAAKPSGDSAAGDAAADADVAFSGTWSVNLDDCKNEQGGDRPPLVLTPTTYDQGEAHCTFAQVKSDGGAWLAKAKCSVEGDEQEGTFKFTVAGDKLTISDDAGDRTLLRCQ